MHEIEGRKIAVVGLGYVGLPLAVEFGKRFDTVGFDISHARIEELQRGIDRTLEIEPDELRSASRLRYAHTIDGIADCDIYIVTVPTPVDAHKRPDLTPLLRASETVGKILSSGNIVIYESTVYPGATEEDCVPVLERLSGLTFNRDFFVGYSPERINPGDKLHRLPSIVKVTSGSTPEAADLIDALYASIITAGTHKAASIKVAEAAKVIENTQRDVNIALINELSLIFGRLGIDTLDVLEAAGTKWNFLPFRPGLVGGHCIGVDPYYLTHKAQETGYHPEVVLAGRRINDNMGAHIANRLVREMISRGVAVRGARALVMGLTFKENCPDLRNSKVVDVIAELRSFGMQVDTHDPHADLGGAKLEYGIDLVAQPEAGAYDGIVLAVAHRDFQEAGTQVLRRYGRTSDTPIFDVKGILERSENILRL